MYTSFFNIVLFLFTNVVYSQVNRKNIDVSTISPLQIDSSPKIQFIKGFDGIELGFYTFCPKDTIKAKMILYHGGGAHSKLGYFKLAMILRDVYQIETILVDIRGHGYSGGKRGDCPTINSLYKDINTIILHVKEHSSLPIYLGGHSSGAGLVLNYSSWKSKSAIDGYFFISPEFGYKSGTKREQPIEFTKIKLWKFIANSISLGLLFPHGKAVFFNYTKSTLKTNPLILGYLSVNMAIAETPKHPQVQFKNIHQNIAIIIGEKDELIDPKKVVEYSTIHKDSTIIISTEIVKNATHLSILNTVGETIGATIHNWN